MKFPINYDLLEKVNSANGNVNVEKIMLEEVKKLIKLYGFYTAVDIVMRRDGGIGWVKIFLSCAVFFASTVTVKTVFDYKFKDKIEKSACLELTKLVVQMGNNLNINTSLELLKQSELIKVEYKIIYQKYDFKIQQDKYILIPAYDGLGDIKDASILQEHEIGSEQYVLSIGSPKRSVALKYAFNN